MIWMLIAVMVVAIAMVVLARRSQKSEPASTAYPYQKSGALFSPIERSFLGVLHQAVEGNATILGKVSVAEVVVPIAGLKGSHRQKAIDKLANTHFDFLLCNRKNLAVLCAIELNGALHPSNRRNQRDDLLKAACEAAGVPLVRVPAQSDYDLDDVKRLIAPYLTAKARPNQKPSPARQVSKISKKVCPNCSAPMVKRITKKGSHAGMAFWTCSEFPECKTVEAIRV
jgi:hypothetical protein